MNIEILKEKIKIYNSVVNEELLSELNDYKNAIQHAHNQNIMFFENILINIKQLKNGWDKNEIKNIMHLFGIEDKLSDKNGLIVQFISNFDKKNNASTNLNIFNKYLTEIHNALKKDYQQINRYLTYFELINTGKPKSNEEDCLILFKYSQNDINDLNILQSNLKGLDKFLREVTKTFLKKSPSKIEIQSVSNGSIDFLFNFNIDLSLNLNYLFTLATSSMLWYFNQKKHINTLDKNGSEKLREIMKEADEILEEELIENLTSKIIEEKNIEGEGNASVKYIVMFLIKYLINQNSFKILKIGKNKDEKNDEKDNKYDDVLNNLNPLNKELKELLIDKENAQKLLKMINKNDEDSSIE